MSIIYQTINSSKIKKFINFICIYNTLKIQQKRSIKK
jgi:hypothetical protein